MEIDLDPMGSNNSIIHVKALCVIFRNEEILVFEARDSLKDQTYYRPLGGHIEFGEYSEAAVRREFCEEVGSEIENLRLLRVFENIFIHEGVPGHEIVFVYDGELVDKTIYDRPFFFFQEDNGETLKVLWKNMADFSDEIPLYPNGLPEFLKKRCQLLNS